IVFQVEPGVPESLALGEGRLENTRHHDAYRTVLFLSRGDGLCLRTVREKEAQLQARQTRREKPSRSNHRILLSCVARHRACVCAEGLRAWTDSVCPIPHGRSNAQTIRSSDAPQRPVDPTRRAAHPLPKTRSTTQQPRTCGPGPRQWLRMSSLSQPASCSASATLTPP